MEKGASAISLSVCGRHNFCAFRPEICAGCEGGYRL